ncbi:DUF5337 domain-containing protein [Pseudoruegeria sp. HB172150]|uniref:DUF5337 domain-containing protein n=1 Tax=Pseudoruegeria sp. HB172150 TaxID=2721164 RepID=UPI001552A207|nr:DUF5337 domain-containing protein [Pseudoruegeria sp. HB172150]
MALTPEMSKAHARQARLVAIVVVTTLVVWLVAQWAGARFGIEERYMFLIDFAAMAAFLWSFIVTYQIWRKRRNNEG